jgi:hypothetical protein
LKKGAYRLCSVFLAALILSVVVAPVCAVETDYFSKDTFWRWMAGSGGVVQKIIGYSFSSACSASDDGYHHASSYTREGKDGTYQCNCIYCGDVFIATESDIKQSYDDYVETLPAPSYTSTGRFIWQPTAADLVECLVYKSQGGYSPSPLDSKYYTISQQSNSSFLLSFDCSNFPSAYSGFSVRASFKNLPVVGSYQRVGGIYGSSRSVDSKGSVFVIQSSNVSSSPFSHYSSADTTALYSVTDYRITPRGYLSFFSTYELPRFEVIPDSVLVGSDTYNINTRPTSITGGNYGIVGDNGQITKVEDNSTIINETNNTFYNPATGTTIPIVNWSYDYSDRSYKVTLESGDTATITYGDENITISQITATEGDTITNNYTIYYLVDGSGSVTPPCDHAWTETNTTPATCTIPGSKLSTCSKCQQTKKDPLPALGHDWQVKQTVTTEYDDTGQLTQQGYTIFECSRCHEQYKSPDGTIPPGGGSGTDPGDEGETIWDKLGKLLGTAVKALLDLLGSAVDVILGGLIDLITNLVESLKQLVDLFGTVGEAFQVLWTWLPPEVTAILVAGVSIFVFVALLKFFMK